MAAFGLFDVPPQQRERHFRNKDALSLDFSDDEQRYRFGRESILHLSEILKDDLQRNTHRNHALTVQQQVMITLRFLASGSFLQVIGDTLGLDKSTVSRVVKAKTEALCRRKDQFIKWPVTQMNRNVTKADFFKLGGFPNVIGAVDGTHVRIQAPHEDEASFVNRKGYHSMNVQAACNAQGKFTSINAAWPGSSHDAHIFRTSQVCTYLEGIQNPPGHGKLLGDNGYPCRPILMTPYTNATIDSHMRYNRHHATTICVIERTLGRWKRRFHILRSEIRMKPSKACSVITACGVLHNISLIMNEPDVCAEQLVIENINEQYHGIQDGRRIRDYITQMYFAN